MYNSVQEESINTKKICPKNFVNFLQFYLLIYTECVPSKYELLSYIQSFASLIIDPIIKIRTLNFLSKQEYGVVL